MPTPSFGRAGRGTSKVSELQLSTANSEFYWFVYSHPRTGKSQETNYYCSYLTCYRTEWIPKGIVNLINCPF